MGCNGVWGARSKEKGLEWIWGAWGAKRIYGVCGVHWGVGCQEQEEGAGLVMGCVWGGKWGASCKHQGARALGYFYGVLGCIGVLGCHAQGEWGAGRIRGAPGRMARIRGAWRTERAHPWGHPIDGVTPLTGTPH